MRKRTIRTLLKTVFPLDAVLLVLVFLDYMFWDSNGMVVLLSVMALLLIGVVVLLALDERPRFTRLPTVDATEPPITISYGRDPHGRP